MEEIIFKYLQEQYQEQKQQLEIKDKELIEKNNEINRITNQKYEEHQKVGSIYIFTTDKPNHYKCGRTF